MNKLILATILVLFQACNINSDKSFFCYTNGLILDIKEKPISKSVGVYKKIKKAITQSRYKQTISCFKIYKYSNCYYLYSEAHTTCCPITQKLFYNPNTDSLSETTNKLIFDIFKNNEINSIIDSRNFLEHLLFTDDFKAVILDSLEQLNQISHINNFNINLESLKNQIGFMKPTIIRDANVVKHIFFVYNRPQEGGTIYRYELIVNNYKIQDNFKITNLFCVGDKWAYE